MSLRSLEPALRKRLLVGLLLVLSLLLLLTAVRQMQGPTQEAKPSLGLMTTLPLQWSEGDLSASIDTKAAPEPAFARLAENYRVIPIDDLKQLASEKPALLLLAQSRAMAPAELVVLDNWIRGGGKALILADPALQWESTYPIGDIRRPLFTSLLSPLFTHWGIELVLPIAEGQKIVVRQIGDMPVRTATPGEWLLRNGDAGSTCVIGAVRMLADCKIGKGRALLVADADLMDAQYWQGNGIRVLSGTDEFGNMRWINQLLGTLGKK